MFGLFIWDKISSFALIVSFDSGFSILLVKRLFVGLSMNKIFGIIKIRTSVKIMKIEITLFFINLTVILSMITNKKELSIIARMMLPIVYLIFGVDLTER